VDIISIVKIFIGTKLLKLQDLEKAGGKHWGKFSEVLEEYDMTFKIIYMFQRFDL